MNIVLFGPPLSGKGTHTKFLQNEYGFDVVSTGALLRQHVEDHTDLGKRIKPILDAGGLIDTNDVIGVIEDAFAQRQSSEGVVFDGTPRRVNEFYKLLDMLQDACETIDKIVVLDVPEIELFKRMNQRRAHAIANGEAPRSDDNANVLKDRLAKYASESVPVIAEAKLNGIDVIHIDGNGKPEEVQDLIADGLGLDTEQSVSQANIPSP